MLPTSAVAQNSMEMPMASASATPPVMTGPTEVSLRIGLVLVDVTKNKTISTIGYNGQVPGPLIRLREGKQVSVQLFNDTDTPEFVHWHGQFIPSEVDGHQWPALRSKRADQDSSGSPLSTRFRQQERRHASAPPASA